MKKAAVFLIRLMLILLLMVFLCGLFWERIRYRYILLVGVRTQASVVRQYSVPAGKGHDEYIEISFVNDGAEIRTSQKIIYPPYLLQIKAGKVFAAHYLAKDPTNVVIDQFPLPFNIGDVIIMFGIFFLCRAFIDIKARGY